MIEITDGDFSVEEIIARMSKPEVGGVISYLGTVRNFSQGRKVERIQFDADEAALGRLREVERKAMSLVLTKVVSQVGDKILLVAVAASHRQPAFAACMSIIDEIKVIHSAWQREVYLSS